MSESTEPTPPLEQVMMTLCERGADRFDPVRYRFIEVLTRRAEAYRGEARRILDGKLAKALGEFGADFEQARGEAERTLHGMRERFPDAAEELQHLYATGDFRGLRRLIARLESQGRRQSLADLMDDMTRRSGELGPGTPADDDIPSASPPTELKSLSYFRETWSKLSVEQQLAQALAQGPENAGPLNSHLLVLESLKVMRDISPGYLKHFMSYVDALVWLEQANGGSAAKSPGPVSSRKKR